MVASSRPPNPTSSTAAPTFASRKAVSAVAVIVSKNDGRTSSSPDSAAGSIRSRIPSSSRLSSGVDTSSPPIRMRSFGRTRCGEVNRPLLSPEASSIAASIAATEPLPLVPPTCTTG